MFLPFSHLAFQSFLQDLEFKVFPILHLIVVLFLLFTFDLSYLLYVTYYPMTLPPLFLAIVCLQREILD